MESSIPSRQTKIRYFNDTDTLYIEFRQADIIESRDVDEDTALDLDAEGRTFEHASDRTDASHLSVGGIAA